LAHTNSIIKPQNESPLAALCRTRPWVQSLLLTTLFGVLTALSAQVRITVPWTPVPITGQVFMVLLAGGLLGARLGALSQLEYLALGAAGMPIFAGGVSGPLAFVGPSGGYLWAFPLAAWVVGTLAQGRGRILRALLASISGVAVIHLFGWAWLGIFLGVKNGGFNALQALYLGVTPFILVDVVKALVASQVIKKVQRSATTGS
jgi:biotin transport system substrate-specific component